MNLENEMLLINEISVAIDNTEDAYNRDFETYELEKVLSTTKKHVASMLYHINSLSVFQTMLKIFS